MIVPYFSIDSDVMNLERLKLLFLVERLRNFDFLIFIFWFIPIMYLIFIKGLNDFSIFFSTLPIIFQKTPSIFSAVGSISFMFFWLLVFFRIRFSYPLFSKMKKFEKETIGFKWNRKKMYWLVIFFPFLSFFVYSFLKKLTKFEIYHKYNL